MKLIYEGDRLVKKIIGEKRAVTDGNYRWSIFTVFHSFDGKDYLFNNFTKICYRLEGEKLDFSEGRLFSSGEVAADETLTQLVAEHFLVKESADEGADYVAFCKLARAMKLKSNGFSKYTILPTTACNARCVYCYEEGIEFVTMSDETLNKTIEFIKKSHDPNSPVGFGWFGGEPLIGEKMIDKICAALREDGIDYKANMISNGSLITADIIKKMKTDWHLVRMQITLDGVEEEYNARKNYIFNYESAYWHILSRIKMINEAEIRLTIRVNVDEQNIGGVTSMVDDLKNFIPNPDLVSFDLAPLFDLQSGEGGKHIWQRSFEVADEIAARGFNIASHYSVSKTKYHYCMADSASSVVIAPDGKLYPCEHVQAVESLGDIWTGVTNTAYQKQLNSFEPVSEKCKGCFSLPECTTFSKCPNIRLDCRYASRKRMERALNRFIRHQSEVLAQSEDETVDC